MPKNSTVTVLPFGVNGSGNYVPTCIYTAVTITRYQVSLYLIMGRLLRIRVYMERSAVNTADAGV